MVLKKINRLITVSGFFVLITCLMSCSTRPDYSNLQVIGVPNESKERQGSGCSALGEGYTFYRYTCTTWTVPAEKCLRSETEINELLKKISAESGQACRILEIIHSRS